MEIQQLHGNQLLMQSTLGTSGKYYWEIKAVSKSSGTDELCGIQGISATAIISQNQIWYIIITDGNYGIGGGASLRKFDNWRYNWNCYRCR